MKKPIYIISDNHFLLEKSYQEKKRREKLFQLFNKIKKTGGTLIIGGDFFDFWVQSFYGVPKYYDDILEELENLTLNNIEIHYVVGNHDYWDFGFIYKKCKAVIHKKDLIFKTNNQKILVTHGDGLLKNDYLYRFMKRIIRSSLFVFLVRLIPSELMSIIARKISNTKLKFNVSQYLNKKCTKELQNYAHNKINEENFNVVLMGHYHQTGIINISNGYFIQLGDWINQYTITILNEDGVWSQESINE